MIRIEDPWLIVDLALIFAFGVGFLCGVVKGYNIGRKKRESVTSNYEGIGK